MDDSEPPMHGTGRAAVCMGRPARRVLMAGRGSVLAAFTSTLYLESEAGIACIAPPSAPCGPLNAIVPGFVLSATVDLDRALWRADETTLAIEGLGTFMLSPRVDWTPPRPPTVDAALLRAGLASVHAALAALPPRGEVLPHVLGASPLRASSDALRSRAFPRAPGGSVTGFGAGKSSGAFPCAPGGPLSSGISVLSAGEFPRPPGGPAARDEARGASLPGLASAPGYLVERGEDGRRAGDTRFARSVPVLARWIGDATCGAGASSSPPVVDLLGAGRGLTPSGDDFLAGTLVALHAFGEGAVAASLARAVTRHASRRTSRLSAAHLEAACAGEAIGPVHEAIRAIAGDTCPGRALDALESFGHDSGFDALAGVLLVARAVACLHVRRERAAGFERRPPG